MDKRDATPDAKKYESMAATAYRDGKLDRVLEASELVKGAPSSSLAEIQVALADDTAAVTWMFAGDDMLIVLGIRRDGCRPAAVKLDPTHQGQLRDYLACVGALAQARPDYKRLVPRIDELVAALGLILLPTDLRDFIAAKARLVLCPHRELDKFPFHAVQWMDGETSKFLIESFTVRYVANLASLDAEATMDTLWPVNDERAKDLRIAFQRAHERGDDPASALADAVRAHLASGSREVFYWAPFFVTSRGA